LATIVVAGSLALGCANDVAVFPGSGGGGAGGTGTGSGSGGSATTTSASGGNSGTTTSGAGGNGAGGVSTSSGVGGSTGSGPPPPCKTCSEGLQGTPGPLCPGSEPLFDAVTTCACMNECTLECFDSCNGMPASPQCEPCLFERCFVELDACFNDA
jgi:hypothetical protein